MLIYIFCTTAGGKCAPARKSEQSRKYTAIQEYHFLGCDAMSAFLCSMLQLQVTANVPSVLFLFTLTMDAAKHQFSQEPHGVIFQKMAFFTVTAVKSSNPTYCQ
jgi:hypothetical protein